MSLGHRRARTTDHGSGRERGAAVLELAIVGLFLVTMAAGTFDFGMGWRAALAVNEGARGGARVGSGLGTATVADVTILTSLQSTLSSNGMLAKVDRVVIFSAKGTGGRPSAECINGTGGFCNTFTGAQFRNVVTSSPVNPKGCILGSTRAGWCPADRIKVQQDAEYLGVWVRARHDHMFPVFGSSLTIERCAVMRIEP